MDCRIQWSGLIPGNVSGAWDPNREAENVSDSGMDGAEHGRYRILCAIPGGTTKGAQASFDRLLGASATRFWRRHDS